jgi:phage-related protein
LANWDVGLPRDGSRASRDEENLPGNRIARVLFCVAHGEMTLLHGFMKKSQKTPKSDLAVAIDRKRRMEMEQ